MCQNPRTNTRFNQIWRNNMILQSVARICLPFKHIRWFIFRQGDILLCSEHNSITDDRPNARRMCIWSSGGIHHMLRSF